MTRRYYPSLRERMARATNEGVKSRHSKALCPYAVRNSGRALSRAFYVGQWFAYGVGIGFALPVVDLSHEFADLVAEIEAHPPKCLERVV